MKRTLALLLSLFCGFSVFAGCNGTVTEEEKAQTLYVATINKGYGMDWLKALLEKFCGDRNMKYKITPAYDDTAIKTVVESGKGYCDYDVVFTGSRNGISDAYLADLTDLVTNYRIESGDRAGKTIKELLGEDLAATFNEEYLFDGEYYNVLPWTAGMSSLLFNCNVMKDTFGANWRELYPCRTTTELLALCRALKENGKYAFINAGNNTQNGSIYYTGWMQYEGVEGVKDFYSGVYYDENSGEYKEGPMIMRQQGIYEGLKLCEDLMYGGEYVYPQSQGLSWEESDTFYMMGYAAMKYSGDWTQIENMKNFSDVDLEYFRAPIISSLGTKLGITESQLIEIIDYVDALKDGKTAVKPTISTAEMTADQLIDRIYEARSVYSSYIDQHIASVVEYNKKELGIEFLKFMISDEGQSIFFKASHGLTQPYGYDAEKDDAYADMNSFVKSRYQIVKDAIFIHANGHLRFGNVGLEIVPYSKVQPVDSAMAQSKVNAQDVFDYGYNQVSGSWNEILMLVNNKYIK